MASCPAPPSWVSDCPPITTYNVGGTDYIAYLLCDTNGTEVLGVFTLCDGVPSGAPTYYDLQGSPYTPIGEPKPCGNGSSYEQEVFCDSGNNDHAFISRVRFDENGDLIPEQSGTFEVDQVTPYAPVGPVHVCASGNQVTVEQVCIFDLETGLKVDTMELVKVLSPADGSIIGVRGYSLDTTTEYSFPLPANLYIDDCMPEALCTPSSAQELNAVCGTWEPVDTDIVMINDANIVDDPTADALCGGSWAHGGESVPAPFPIEDRFRSGVYSGNWVEYGAAHLTSGVEDGVGEGWLQLNTNAYAEQGAVINQDTFPTATANFVVEFTAAVSNPSGAGAGDGFSIMFLDGTQPMPPSLGGPAGAYSYTPHCSFNAPGIRYGVFEAAFDIWGGHGSDGSTGNPGVLCPGGEIPNNLTIRGSGDAQDPPCSSNEYPCITRELLPFDLGTHDRLNPMRVRLSVITENGVTYLSAAVDDGNGFQPVITRYDISSEIALPSQLRVGLVGASGGAYHSYHEIRDLNIAPPGKQYWRALSIETDAIPDCATGVQVTASVDVKITEDSQDKVSGDNDPEHFLRLVNAVTGEIYDAKVINSAPANVGSTVTLSVDSGVIDAAEIPDLRIYFGTEAYDISGEYGSIWSNLQINAGALGCPPVQYRTIPISAPCPIPVTLVGGGDGGTSIFNAPNTFDLELVCADGQPAFRREIRNAAGDSIVQFLGLNGQLVSPTTWVPGTCTESVQALGDFCYLAPARPTGTQDESSRLGEAWEVAFAPATDGNPPADPSALTFNSAASSVGEAGPGPITLASLDQIRTNFGSSTDSEGAVYYLNTQTGQRYPVPPVPGLAYCEAEGAANPDYEYLLGCADGLPIYLRMENDIPTGYVGTNGADYVPTGNWTPGDCTVSRSWVSSQVVPADNLVTINAAANPYHGLMATLVFDAPNINNTSDYGEYNGLRVPVGYSVAFIAEEGEVLTGQHTVRAFGAARWIVQVKL